MEITFAGKTFVVLGRLSTMTRHEAKLKVQSLGGHVSDAPGRSSDYFIQGDRVSASRQRIVDAVGCPILSEQEFIDAVEAARAEAAEHEEHVDLGDAIASFRGLFDGPPSREAWERTAALLDECSPAQLADACRYVESHVSRWPDHRDDPRAPSMRERLTYRHDPPSDDPISDLRVVTRAWLSELLEGMESPKFSLIRTLSMGGMTLNGKTMAHLVSNPTLTRVREFDVGHGNPITQTFYKKLRTTTHLPALDTLTLRTMSVKHARALCGDHTLGGLRWVRLGYPEKQRRNESLSRVYGQLFEAAAYLGVVVPRV